MAGVENAARQEGARKTAEKALNFPHFFTRFTQGFEINMSAILCKLWSLHRFHPDNGARLLRFLSSNRPLVWPINLVLNGAWQLRKRLRAKTTVTPNRRGAALLQAPCHVPAATLFARHVLIIAELSIRQCKKYRVDQKVAELESLGYRVTVCSWGESAAC